MGGLLQIVLGIKLTNFQKNSQIPEGKLLNTKFSRVLLSLPNDTSTTRKKKHSLKAAFNWVELRVISAQRSRWVLFVCLVLIWFFAYSETCMHAFKMWREAS